MRRLAAAAVALLVAMAGAATTAAAPGSSGQALEMYTARVDADQAGELGREGFDVVARRDGPDGVEVDLVLSDAERDRLAKRGVDVAPKRNQNGKTHRQLAQEQATGGYQVWRSWDQAGGTRDELHEVARQNPQLVKLEVLGHTYGGRELIALKLTQGARGVADGSRPSVLYSSTQHAREWISLEVNRRLLHWYIDRWRANDQEMKSLLQTTELWFVIAANPDGYQHTFDVERLWRKNLRDNDGDGAITNVDGVDPNRNFDAHFKHDNEGRRRCCPARPTGARAPPPSPRRWPWRA